MRFYLIRFINLFTNVIGCFQKNWNYVEIYNMKKLMKIYKKNMIIDGKFYTLAFFLNLFLQVQCLLFLFCLLFFLRPSNRVKWLIDTAQDPITLCIYMYLPSNDPESCGFFQASTTGQCLMLLVSRNLDLPVWLHVYSMVRMFSKL